MRKAIVVMMVGVMMLTAVSVQAETGEGRGGVIGFFAGCCFGPRCAADYNDGKSIHWLEWGTLIPYAGIVFAVWNGVNGASGMTRAQYAEQYGSVYY